MTRICLNTAYLAPISYYYELFNCEYIEIDAWGYYIKQTYRNRCNIIAANGIMPLSIPVEKPTTGKCPTRDIRISSHDNWQHLHWNAIVSAYSSTPFFEYYQDDFFPFYKNNAAGKFLFDFNESLRETICSLLGINPDITYSPEYKTVFEPDETDFREAIHPKHPVDTGFVAQPYYQVFADRHGFIPDMSIIDLLFNTGPEAVLTLQR